MLLLDRRIRRALPLLFIRFDMSATANRSSFRINFILPLVRRRLLHLVQADPLLLHICLAILICLQLQVRRRERPHILRIRLRLRSSTHAFQGRAPLRAADRPILRKRLRQLLHELVMRLSNLRQLLLPIISQLLRIIQR